MRELWRSVVGRWGNAGAVANVRTDLEVQRFGVERVQALERRVRGSDAARASGRRRRDHPAA